MKRMMILILALCMLLPFTSCKPDSGTDTAASAMYIEAAQLTEEEANIVKLLGAKENGQNRIFDFVLDDSVQSLQVNTYELIDGAWSLVSGGGGWTFSDPEGRIALCFDKLTEGLRVALQSEHSNSSNTHMSAAEYDFTGMGCATSSLNNRTEILYEQEIPLVVQIVTTQNEVRSYNVEYFHHPEEYAKHNYEHVYAITIRFSQKTVEELSAVK